LAGACHHTAMGRSQYTSLRNGGSWLLLEDSKFS
jgi:hypothetical protein